MRMTTAPLEPLICRLALPSIASQLITAMYHSADTFFVGTLGTSATAAVGVIFSYMAIVQAIGFMFGHGAGNYVARELGACRYKNASKMAATAFCSALIMGAVIAVAGTIFLEEFAVLLGATPTSLPYAKAYLRFILLGTPWMAASLMLNHTLRYEGSSFFGMLGIMSGAVLNIALDPLFIYWLGMGTAGAGLATIISQFVSFCVLLAGSARGENIKITVRDFSPRPAIYAEILRGGFPALCRQSLSSVSTICINRVAGSYGDAALAGFSVVQRITQVMSSVLMGFGQGFQPVCGFNYGAKKYARVLKAFWFAFRLSCAGLTIFSAAAFVFAPHLIAFFRNDPAVITIGTRYLRVFCLTLPCVSWIIINNMMHQTLGKAKSAGLLALSRQGLFLLPLVFVLPRFFGLDGLRFCQPLSNVATAILALPLGISTLKELRQKQNTQ